MAPTEIDKEQEKAINQRPNYFAGQYLLEDDFQLEQKYHIDRQRRHNRLLHVSGIAEGLKVSENKDLTVKVSAGTAIDSQGRQIIRLLDKQDVDLVDLLDVNNKKPILDGVYNLLIKYSEVLTHKQESEGSEETTNRRVQEKPEFELSELTTPDVIPLAKLTIKGGKVENIDLSVRQYSGICLPTEEGKGVTLRSDGEKNPKLAVLDGSLSISGKLAVTEDTELKKTLTVKGNTTLEQELTVKNLFLGESGNGVRLRSHGAENPNLAELTGSLSMSGTLEVKGKTTLKGDITTPGSLTAEKITDGKVTITKGTIQKGSSEIDLSKEENPDLGLYSQEEGKWIRFVSNKGDFFFSSAGKYGKDSDPLVKIDPQGNLTAKGGLTVTENTQLNKTLTVKENTTLLQDLNVSGNLTITMRNNIPGNINTNGSLTAEKITAERIFVTTGFIQKFGDEPLAASLGSDLGLYSRRATYAMRFVTNGGDFIFSTDGKYGEEKKFMVLRATPKGKGVDGTIRLFDSRANYWTIAAESEGANTGSNLTVYGNDNPKVGAWLSRESGVWTSASDAALKEKVEPMQGILEKTMRLNPAQFVWKHTQQQGIGFIAQELEQIFPGLVNGTSREGKEIKGIAYPLVPVIAIAALQEMKKEYDREIQDLKQQVKTLQKLVPYNQEEMKPA